MTSSEISLLGPARSPRVVERRAPGVRSVPPGPRAGVTDSATLLGMPPCIEAIAKHRGDAPTAVSRQLANPVAARRVRRVPLLVQAPVGRAPKRIDRSPPVYADVPLGSQLSVGHHPTGCLAGARPTEGITLGPTRIERVAARRRGLQAWRRGTASDWTLSKVSGRGVRLSPISTTPDRLAPASAHEETTRMRSGVNGRWGPLVAEAGSVQLAALD
jgi:hypothetical protein